MWCRTWTSGRGRVRVKVEAAPLFHYRRRKDDGMDLTPLIDVVFQLLIFFMVSSQFVKHDRSVELPLGGEGVKADKAAPLVVEVTAGGLISVNGEACAESGLENVLRGEIEATGEGDVQFRGDRSIPYGDFVGLMEIAKRAGASKFQIVKMPEEAVEE